MQESAVKGHEFAYAMLFYTEVVTDTDLASSSVLAWAKGWLGVGPRSAVVGDEIITVVVSLAVSPPTSSSDAVNALSLGL